MILLISFKNSSRSRNGYMSSMGLDVILPSLFLTALTAKSPKDGQ
jgi:hypothetical protein